MIISPSVVLPALRIRRVNPTPTYLALPLLEKGHLQPTQLPCRPSCSLASPSSSSESSRTPIPSTSNPSWRSSTHSISMNEAIFLPKSCRLSTSPFPTSAVKATSKALAVAPRDTLVAGKHVLRPKLIDQSRGAIIC
jgi:hypothetical protein